MTPAEAGDFPYQLDFSGLIAEAIRKLQRQATREGRGPQFLKAIREVVDRLHHEPLSFGEPLYRLPVLRMQVRCAAIRPLVVDFAVSEEHPLVIIKAVKLLAQ